MSSLPKLEVFCRRFRPHMGGTDVEFWVRDRYDSIADLPKDRGVEYHAQITMIGHPEGSTFDPSFRLDETRAQLLMDRLWDCGFRPSAGAGSAGAMDAVTRHLEDMRTLVFQQKGPPHLTDAQIKAMTIDPFAERKP